MTILIIGGAGFIGSNHIFYHLEKYPEDKVVCIDKLTYAGNLSTLASLLDPTNPTYKPDQAARFKFLKPTSATVMRFTVSLRKRSLMWS